MKKLRKFLAAAMAFMLMVTGLSVNGLTANAETQWEETAITSIKYDVTVAGVTTETSFGWTVQDASWTEQKSTITLKGNGAYTITPTWNSATGIINLGFVSPIAGSNMTVTMNKITVNGYELTYETAPVLKPVDGSNGLYNIWSGLADGTVICSSAQARLAFDKTANLIKLYVAKEAAGEATWKETAITSIKYDVMVAGVTTETSFGWTVQDASWTEQKSTITLNGNGAYTITPTWNSATGIINLGFVSPIAGSNMTVTMNKITVNGYELTYETAPVLKPVDGSNGLYNIWSQLADGTVICSNANAHLAFDKTANLIKLYVKSAGSGTGDGGVVIGDTASLQYVKAMGDGWNLGNSFDGFDDAITELGGGEEAWGNPVVTKALIQAVKEKGYDSIRMPFTIYTRYTVNANAGEGECKYVIDADWLARYKEVVDWAVEEDLYVMVNIHHDSWTWLSDWDGNKASEEYRMFTDFWKQLATCFKDEPATVCFETINEPTFEATGDITVQDKLDMINKAAYEVIRGISGNETRMIVMPTLSTNHEKGLPLYNLITELDDEYIIATVHYYSEWVYSANLGKTGFDEVLWKNESKDYTPRDSVDSMMDTVYKQFTKNGIGVIIGEWGLLGYDKNDGCLQTGEELKYYEYMNEMAGKYGVCLVFWDNGSGISRENYEWKYPVVGEMLEASMSGRSSYATGLDTLYYNSAATADVEIPLTLNGNTFVGIEGLTEGTDYTYDEASETVTLKASYINAKYNAMSGYGTFADLVFQFSSGADWHEYLVKFAAPVVGSATGNTTDGIAIPVTFNGSRVQRVTAYQVSGRVGPNSDWWEWLQYGETFDVDYANGTFKVLKNFFTDSTVKDGLVKFKVQMYDGQIIYIWVNITGSAVTSSTDLAVSADTLSASAIICLYTGETAIPAQYINVPAGGSVYGVYADEDTNNGMVAFNDWFKTSAGWGATMSFDTVAHEDFVDGAIILAYMDTAKRVDVQFGIKNAPVVSDVEVAGGRTAGLTISNLAENAVLSYEIDDTTIATVDEAGVVTGLKKGTTTITVTVTQYNRTDAFKATVTVTSNGTAATPTPAPTTEPTPAPTTEPTAAPTTAPTTAPSDDVVQQITNFATRMYTVVLERDPDAGMETWTNGLIAHEYDGAFIAYGFIMSEEFTSKNLSNEEFVAVLYSTFFDREADADGLATWLGLLEAGASRGYVLSGFVNSNEFDALCESFGILRGYMKEDGTPANVGIRKFVERCYSTVMGREGDKEGLEMWTNLIITNQMTAEDVAKMFFASEEFTGKNTTDAEYIDILYTTFLDRTADDEGRTTWTNALAGGMTRDEVLLGFSQSNEFKAILEAFGL